MTTKPNRQPDVLPQVTIDPSLNSGKKRVAVDAAAVAWRMADAGMKAAVIDRFPIHCLPGRPGFDDKKKTGSFVSDAGLYGAIYLYPEHYFPETNDPHVAIVSSIASRGLSRTLAHEILHAAEHGAIGSVALDEELEEWELTQATRRISARLATVEAKLGIAAMVGGGVGLAMQLNHYPGVVIAPLVAAAYMVRMASGALNRANGDFEYVQTSYQYYKQRPEEVRAEAFADRYEEEVLTGAAPELAAVSYGD